MQIPVKISPSGKSPWSTTRTSSTKISRGHKEDNGSGLGLTPPDERDEYDPDHAESLGSPMAQMDELDAEPSPSSPASTEKSFLLAAAEKQLSILQTGHKTLNDFLQHHEELQLKIKDLAHSINNISTKIENFKQQDTEPFDASHELSTLSQQLIDLLTAIKTNDFSLTRYKKVATCIGSMLVACQATSEIDTPESVTEKNRQLWSAVIALAPTIRDLQDSNFMAFYKNILGNFKNARDSGSIEMLFQYFSELGSEIEPKVDDSEPTGPSYLGDFLRSFRNLRIKVASEKLTLTGNDLVELLEALQSYFRLVNHETDNLLITTTLMDSLRDQPLDFFQLQKFLLSLDQIQNNLKKEVGAIDTDQLAEKIDECYRWCQHQGEVLLRTSKPVNMQKQEDVAKIFSIIKARLRGLDPTLDQQANSVMQQLLTPTTDALHEDWARIALALEVFEKQAAITCKKAQEMPSQSGSTGSYIDLTELELSRKGLELQFIQKNLAALVSISNLQWAEHAKSMMVKKIVDHEADRTDWSYEKSTTTTVSAEPNALQIARAKFNVTYVDKELNDDEGNFNLIQTLGAGATAGVHAGVNAFGMVNVSAAKAEAGLSGTVGRLKEYKNLQYCIQNEFEEYLKKYGDATWLMPFTTRHSSLGEEQPADDMITVRDLPQMQKDYQARYKQMGLHFELLWSTALSDPAPQQNVRTNTLLTIMHPAETSDCSPLEATMRTLGGKALATAGLEVEALGYALGGVHSSTSTETSGTGLELTRQTPMLEKFMTLEKLAGADTAEQSLHPSLSEPKPITVETDLEESNIPEEDLDSPASPLRQAETDSLQPEDIPKFSVQDIQLRERSLTQKQQIITEVSKKSQKLLQALDEDYQYLKHQRRVMHGIFSAKAKTEAENIFDSEAIPIPASVYESELVSGLNPKRKIGIKSFLSWIWEFLDRNVLTKISTTADNSVQITVNYGIPLGGYRQNWNVEHGPFDENLGKWKKNFQLLKNEFGVYSTLQSQLAQKAIGSAESIQAFLDYYHAKSTEDCLYHMQLLNMNAAIQLHKLSANPTLSAEQHAEITVLKEELLKFEQVLNKPDFEFDRKKLMAMTSFKEDVTITTKNIKLSASADIGLGPSETQGLFRSQGAVSVEIRNKAIPIPLRSGLTRDYRYSSGWLTGLGSADSATEFFSSLLANHAQSMSDLVGLQAEISQHYQGSVALGRDVTYLRRVYQPDLFPGIEPTWLFTQATNNKSLVMASKIPVPFVTLGLERVATSSSLNNLQCSPHTIMYFLMLYQHDFTADKSTVYNGFGKEGEQLNWTRIRQTQGEALAGLFSNVARRDQSDEASVKLKKELDIIHRTLTNNLMKSPKTGIVEREAELAKLNKIQAAFFEAAEAFHASSPTDRPSKYDAALDSFQRLMFAYCPHLNEMRATSTLAVAQDFTLPEIESVAPPQISSPAKTTAQQELPPIA